jgi:hypothetical protein
LLWLFPNISTVLPCQSIYYLSLCCGFVLHAHVLSLSIYF